jgi:hypothetical protein
MANVPAFLAVGDTALAQVGNGFILQMYQTISTIKTLVEQKSLNSNKNVLEGYTRQLIYDFVRDTYLNNNKVVLGSSVWKDVQIAYSSFK